MQWENDGRTLPPLIDIEWPYFSGVDDCYGLAPVGMTAWISAFIDEIETTINRKPTIYTNLSWWNPCTGSSAEFADHPLDISSCEPTPPVAPGWGERWTFWQYDLPECGRGAEVLADVFNGTLAELAALAGGQVTEPP
jgi:GH25 family lysozyme M1 (1,4-beta-N-acetylmuramidase)